MEAGGVVKDITCFVLFEVEFGVLSDIIALQNVNACQIVCD